MADSKQYKVQYVRGDDGEWSAQIVDPAGGSSEVSGHSFRTARLRAKKAIAESLGSEDAAENAEVVDEIKLPVDLSTSLASLRRKRDMLEMLDQEVRHDTLRLAKILLSQYGLGVRDASKYVGLSFQRLAAVLGVSSSEK